MKYYKLLTYIATITILLILCGKAPEIMEYDEIDEKPELISRPVVEYPEIAKNEGIQGRALTGALVDIDGTIAEVEILESRGHELLDNAALECARTARFKPAQHMGRPVRVWISMPIEFRLTDKS